MLKLCLVVGALLVSACSHPVARTSTLPAWSVEAPCRIGRDSYILVGSLASPDRGRPTCSSFWLIPEEDFHSKVVIHHDYVATESDAWLVGRTVPAGTWIEEVTFSDAGPPVQPVKGRVYLVKRGTNRRNASVLIEQVDPAITEMALLKVITEASAGTITFDYN